MCVSNYASFHVDWCAFVSTFNRHTMKLHPQHITRVSESLLFFFVIILPRNKYIYTQICARKRWWQRGEVCCNARRWRSLQHFSSVGTFMSEPFQTLFAPKIFVWVTKKQQFVKCKRFRGCLGEIGWVNNILRSFEVLGHQVRTNHIIFQTLMGLWWEQ